MHDEFLSNLAKMSREELGTHYDNISKEKNHGRSLMLDPDLTDDQVRDEIIALLDEPSLDYGDDEISESILKIIVAEGAALKNAGLLGEYHLNYDAIQEAVHEEALRLDEASDVVASRDEVIDMIAALDPDTVSDREYIDDESGEILLAYGQKAGSSHYHPAYSNLRKPSWYAGDHDHDEDADDAQDQYQAAIEEYSADFQGEQYDDPTGAAMDAAEGFFTMHPEWKTWSQELGLSKKDMTDAVRDLVYSSIMGEGLQLEAEYKGREVPLGKPMKGDTAKFKVYVKDKKTGNVKKVNFGAKGMEIRRDNPKARKSFRARHGCGTSRASDRTKAAYWSCRMWSSKPVSKIIGGK